MTKIAIIEDDATINQMYRMKFEADGFDVRIANNGKIGVELVDAAEKTIARSKPITGDNLRHVVAWETSLQLAAWAGEPVALRFRLHQAQLYAFAFRKTTTTP